MNALTADRIDAIVDEAFKNAKLTNIAEPKLEETESFRSYFIREFRKRMVQQLVMKAICATIACVIYKVTKG